MIDQESKSFREIIQDCNGDIARKDREERKHC
mgnify:FL=1